MARRKDSQEQAARPAVETPEVTPQADEPIRLRLPFVMPPDFAEPAHLIQVNLKYPALGGSRRKKLHFLTSELLRRGEMIPTSDDRRHLDEVPVASHAGALCWMLDHIEFVIK